MKDVQLTVIIPVYNAQSSLERCAESVLSQAPAQTQLILVNDGSTDESPALCDRLAQQDDRVQVIHQANGGASAARNAGLAAAKGQWIQFVDADDCLAPGLYQEAEKRLCQGADVFFFAIERLSGTFEEALPQGDFESLRALLPRITYFVVDTGIFASPVNKIYRASLLEGLRFDEALSINEDLLFNLKALQRCRGVCLCSQKFYLCDDRAQGSLSRRLRTDLLDAEEYTRQAFLDFLRHCGLNEEQRRQVLLLRQQNVAVSQCALLFGRRGDLDFKGYRKVFSRLLKPRHHRRALVQWVCKTYSPLPRMIYLLCIQLRLACVLAGICLVRSRQSRKE